MDDGYIDRAVDLNRDHRPAGPLRGGKYSRFEGGIRIPFIVSCPGTVRRGVSHALYSQVDLLASFAAMFNAEIPACDSEDHLAALLGEDDFGRSEIYAEGTHTGKVLRQGRWLYIEPDSGRPVQGETGIETANTLDQQLYNLDYDLGQQKNVAWRYPDIAARMASRIEEIKKNEKKQ